jgi:peptide deformylase
MAIRTLVTYPDPLLRETSAEIRDPGGVGQLIADMAETMYAANGAGLAAIQVGEPLRLFIVDPLCAGGSEEDPPLAFVNPELIITSEERETLEEGCLSFPEVFLSVPRSLGAKIRATDERGAPFELEAEGFFARALQHEMDHLQGRLIIDYVGRIKRQLVERRLRESSAQRGTARSSHRRR